MWPESRLRISNVGRNKQGKWDDVILPSKTDKRASAKQRGSGASQSTFPAYMQQNVSQANQLKMCDYERHFGMRLRNGSLIAMGVGAKDPQVMDFPLSLYS